MKTKKKIRIQTFDNEGYQIQDRLVEQDIELATGPKEVHRGPLRIEVNLFEKNDVDKFMSYLQKLVGDLPIETPGKAKPKTASKGKTVLEPQHREAIINYTLSLKSQDEIIDYLRSEGFEFLTHDYLESLKLDTGITDKHKQKYQWMLKLVKRAKNPLNSKYDPTLCFGIKFVGKKLGTYVIYLYSQLHKVAKAGWKEKRKISFKNTDMTKFPPYMVQEEKDKFLVELTDLRRFPERKPSKFFDRWAKDVEFKDKSEILKRISE